MTGKVTGKRRFGFGSLLAWLTILPKTKLGWQILYRRFALWRRMIGEFLHGTFKTPWGTLIAVIAIALYVLMPFDLIPDFFLFFGWLDDAFVVMKLFSLLKIDLRRFIKQKHMDPTPFDLQENNQNNDTT